MAHFLYSITIYILQTGIEERDNDYQINLRPFFPSKAKVDLESSSINWTKSEEKNNRMIG